MCYDARMSIIALTINIISVIFLLHFSKHSSPKEKSELMIISYFFLYVGVMQFWDTVFWLNDSNTVINQYSTKAAMLWNHFEPIVLFLLIWIINGKMKRTSFIFIGLYMVACIIYSVSIFSKLGGTKQTKRSGDSLEWEWNYFKFNDLFYMLFLATLVVLFYFEFDGWTRNVSIFITITSFLFSVYKYQFNVSVGRFWCYIAAFFPLIYLIKLIYKNH
jgi:hypothetical protein